MPIAESYNDDFALARAAASFDAPAQEKIFNLYHNLVYSICLKITREVETAEDLSQECFIQIYKKIHLYKGEARLKTWIYRLAVNQCLMFLRKNKGAKHAPLEGEIGYSSDQPDKRILLEKCLAQLPPGFRNTLLLFYIFGYSHEEVARIMSVSPGTVKSQIFKARHKMRRLINKRSNPRGRFSF